MPMIVVTNPEKKKPASGSKKKGKTMAAKKEAVVKYKYRKPSKKEIQKAARALGSRAKARGQMTVAGMEIGAAAKGGALAVIGIFAAQFAAKKFADGGGATEDWNWKNYIIGPIGAFVVAFIVSGVLGGKKGSAKWILAGGFAYVLWQFARNEVIAGNAKLEEYFAGYDDEDVVDGLGFDGYDDDDDDEGVAIGDVDESGAYVMGASGWVPLDELHRAPSGGGMMGLDDDVVSVNPQMGASDIHPAYRGYDDDVVSVNPQMGNISDRFRQMYGGRASGF